MGVSTSEHQPSQACPTFFRALCRTSYDQAGYGLVPAVAELIDLEGAERDEALAELDAAICPRVGQSLELPDDAAVIAWFERMLPRCMALVPTRRHASFLKGVYRYVREEENDVTTY